MEDSLAELMSEASGTMSSSMGISHHLTTVYRDLLWLSRNGAPTAANVLDFFRGPDGSSPFWDVTCANELCIQQGRDPREASRMAGLRYDVAVAPHDALRKGDRCGVNAHGHGTWFGATVVDVHAEADGSCSVSVEYENKSRAREPGAHVRAHGEHGAFTIRKVRREAAGTGAGAGAARETVEAMFYVLVSYVPQLSASAYRCPDIEAVVATRVENASFHLRNAFEGLRAAHDAATTLHEA